MIRTCSFSAAGGHAVNEDAFALLPRPGGWFVALADGQGGRAGGERAAQLACQVAAEQFLATDSLAEATAAADEAVLDDFDAGYTTLVVLHVEAGHVTGTSCGDSAAVAVCGNAAPSVLTSRQFKNPPVGSGDPTFVPFEAKLTAPWKVLAMSDGVWKYVGWPKIHELASLFSGEELIANLQSAARLRSGKFQDDFTVVLLESE